MTPEAVTETLATSVIDRGVLETTQVVARVHRIQEVMSKLMKKDVHFGQIPGTPKPTLYKPGAELLLMTFRIAASPSHIEDLSTADEIRYRVTVRGTNQVTGDIVGEMAGECSSSEEKYRWRKPVCDEEFDETEATRRREKWMRAQSGPFKVKQVRTSPADVANTILKMAVKRAMIAMTLVALGASDIFAQDLEDLAEELRDSVGADATPAEPKKEVQRASEKNGGTKAAEPTKGTNGYLVTPALTVKDVRAVDIKKGANAGKTMYVIILADKQEYTTYDATLAREAEQFKGTDHLVKVAYEKNDWQGKTYLNAKNLAIADAVMPAAAAVSSAAVDQSEIPFGR